MKKIIISGEIGWDVTPDRVREQLNAANGADIDVHIASPGGYVSDGLEIFNLFRDYKREHPQTSNMVTIKGIAASMATYLAVNPAFDLIAAEDNAVFMIHNAWGCACGDYRDMKKVAEILDGLTGIIGKAYESKTGKKTKVIRQMMDDETWLFGEEILDAGFVDEIIKTDDEAAKSQSVASAKLQFSSLSQRIKENPENMDLNKIAAVINVGKALKDPKSGLEFLGDINNTKVDKIEQTPVENAGKNKMEVQTMTFKELLDQNPTAKIEHDKVLKDSFEAGVKSGQETMQAKILIAAKYLGPAVEGKDEYPSQIKSIAIDVLDGKKSSEALETTVAAFDALKEANKSTAAKKEGDGIGDTAGEQHKATTQDGTIKNEADFDSEVKRTKAANGMEV